MCGIFGIYNLDQTRPLKEARFAAALSRIAHRGPDASSVRRYGDRALLGHVRLSIIDLASESNQPMVANGHYHIVYNGEIFNYLELRAELVQAGAHFVTRSDTEVLVQAYAHWGEKCVQRFNGMWAFAILDTRSGKLFCSRDRFGEKPFYWTLRDGQFLFASEIKALLAYDPELAQADYGSIENFCRRSIGAQHENTWFRDIRRLAPGHNATLCDGHMKVERYWRYPTQAERDLKEPEAVERYRTLFDDSVRLRLRSDVPLGVTLSSGVDSASIACTMQAQAPTRHHCFTAAFDPSGYQKTEYASYSKNVSLIDEAVVASRLAEEIGLDPHRVDTDYGDVVSSLSEVLRHLESGNSSPAVLPLMQVMREARRHVKVVLEGQGADELLGGYIVSALWPAIADEVRAGRMTSAIRSLRGFLEGHAIGYSVKIALRNASNSLPQLLLLHQRAAGIDAVFSGPLRDNARRKDYPDLPGEGGGGALSRLLLHQHSGGLVNLLHYGDAVSMAHGVESRNPFLDYRLVELVWGLPSRVKVRDGVGKHLHREAMRGRVPAYILDQKAKFGFTTPIAQQFKSVPGSSAGTHDRPADVLLSPRCTDRGLFDRTALDALLRAHREGQADHGNLLFRLLSVELWHREFIDEGGGPLL
jgi:asparagine synthase (glutamine-hydrolysing)